MKPETEKILSEFQQQFHEEVTKQVASMRERMEGQVRAMLNARAEMLVAKMMGFDDRWDRWEVDHCNGRQGESAAGDFIREKCKVGVRKWLEEQAGNMPDLPKAAARELLKGYQEEMKKALRIELSKLAAVHAKEKIASILTLAQKKGDQ